MEPQLQPRRRRAATRVQTREHSTQAPTLLKRQRGHGGAAIRQPPRADARHRRDVRPDPLPIGEEKPPHDGEQRRDDVPGAKLLARHAAPATSQPPGLRQQREAEVRPPAHMGEIAGSAVARTGPRQRSARRAALAGAAAFSFLRL